MMGTQRWPCLALLLAAACVLSPFTGAGHDGQRMAQLAFLGIAAFWIVASDEARWVRLPAPRSAASLLILFVALGALSTSVSVSPLDGAREVLVLALSLLAAHVVGAELAQAFAARLRLVLYTLAAGCIVYLFQIVVIYAATLLSQFPYDPFLFAPGFANFRHLNHMQTVSLPLLVLGSLCCPPKQRRWWLGLAAAWAFLLAAHGARGSVLALAVGVVVALALYRGRAVPFFKSMLLTALGGIATFYALFQWIPLALGLNPLRSMAGLVDRSASGGVTSMRDLLWTRALHFMTEDPLLGIGPAHYGKWAIDLGIAAHPHNWVMQIGAEWGLPALLCVLGAIVLAARALIRTGARLPSGDARSHDIQCALVATGTAILVDGLVSGVIVMPGSQLMITLYIGCATGWVMSSNPTAMAENRALPRPAIAAFLLPAILMLAIASAHDVRGLNSEDAAAATVRPYPYAELTYPHFWHDVYFTDEQLRQVTSCQAEDIPPCP